MIISVTFIDVKYKTKVDMNPSASPFELASSYLIAVLGVVTVSRLDSVGTVYAVNLAILLDLSNSLLPDTHRPLDLPVLYIEPPIDSDQLLPFLGLFKAARGTTVTIVQQHGSSHTTFSQSFATHKSNVRADDKAALRDEATRT